MLEGSGTTVATRNPVTMFSLPARRKSRDEALSSVAKSLHVPPRTPLNPVPKNASFHSRTLPPLVECEVGAVRLSVGARAVGPAACRLGVRRVAASRRRFKSGRCVATRRIVEVVTRHAVVFVIGSFIPLVFAGKEPGGAGVAGDRIGICGDRRSAQQSVRAGLGVTAPLPVLQPVGKADRVIPTHCPPG